MRKDLVLGTALLAMLVSACDKSDPNISGVEDHFIEAVFIQPVVDTIFVNETFSPASQAALTATLINKAGNTVAGAQFVWRSSDPTVAIVDGSGVVSAVGLGTTEITASAGKTGKALVVVLPEVKDITVSSAVSQVLAGDTVQLTAVAFDYLNAPMPATFTWGSSAPDVATIDQTGRVIFVAPGSATFTASASFRTGSVTITALPRSLLYVDAGGDFTCGATSLGRGYCFGRGDVNQLASASDSMCFNDGEGAQLGCTLEPKRFSGPAIDFRVVSAGGEHACGVSAQQMIYCWGSDSSGQIGNGLHGGGGPPTLATVGSERFTTVSAGEAHACALNLSGAAYCWGNDGFGQLGDHRRVNSSTPIPVIGSMQFTRISAGLAHTCAIQQGGSAWCWGDGRLGANGNGVGAIIDTPSRVSGSEQFVEISAGSNHSCGVTTGGSVFCWGGNDSGQVGTSTGGAPQMTPALVGGGFTSVSAGHKFTCALTTGGDVQCWGKNSYGQLGRGESNPSGFQTGPATVVGNHNFTSITAGRRHACAVSSDGETYCWGSNMLASLGNQLQAAVRSTPVRVATPR